MLTNTLGFVVRNGFGPGRMMNGGRMMGSGWMLLAMGIRIVIFIVLIILAVKLYKKLSHKPNSALQILNEKFALGEITEEEYLRKKSILNEKN